jgi:hypothetical protein
MKLDPDMHIVMHLVFFGKTSVTRGLREMVVGGAEDTLCGLNGRFVEYRRMPREHSWFYTGTMKIVGEHPLLIPLVIPPGFPRKIPFPVFSYQNGMRSINAVYDVGRDGNFSFPFTSLHPMGRSGIWATVVYNLEKYMGRSRQCCYKKTMVS